MMNPMKIISIYLLLASLLLASCQKIFFNKDEDRREILLEDFNAVKIIGIYNVILIQDSSNRLIISGVNSLSSISADIHNDTLVIDDHRKMDFNTAKNSLEIHFSTLNYMETRNPVNVTNKDTLKTEGFLYEALGEIAEVRLVVDCNSIYIVNSANTLGNFHISGKAVSSVFFNRYGSNVFADSLICTDAEIVDDSVGDVHINASDNIKAYIWGSGNIYFHGNPAIEIAERRGTGRLIRVNF